MSDMSFFFAVTLPSKELEWQASGASGSDRSSNDCERPSQEVLRYEIRRLSVSEGKGGEMCTDVVWYCSSAQAASFPVV